VDYNGYNISLLTHLANVNNVNNVKCARYLLESQIVSNDDQQVAAALNIAMEYQNEEAIKLLMNFKYLEEKQKRRERLCIELFERKREIRIDVVISEKNIKITIK